MDGVAMHIDNILNEVLVLFLACMNQGVQCSYHWFIRAVSTVESYQIREIIQDGIAHSSDGIAKTVNLSLEGFLWCETLLMVKEIVGVLYVIIRKAFFFKLL